MVCDKEVSGYGVVHSRIRTLLFIAIFCKDLNSINTLCGPARLTLLSCVCSCSPEAAASWSCHTLLLLLPSCPLPWDLLYSPGPHLLPRSCSVCKDSLAVHCPHDPDLLASFTSAPPAGSCDLLPFSTFETFSHTLRFYQSGSQA